MLIRSIRRSISSFLSNTIVFAALCFSATAGLITGMVYLDGYLTTWQQQHEAEKKAAAKADENKKTEAELNAEIDAWKYDNVKRYQEWIPECHKSELNKLIDSCLVDNIISQQEYDIISKKYCNLHDDYMLSVKQKRLAEAKQAIRSAFDK